MYLCFAFNPCSVCIFLFIFTNDYWYEDKYDFFLNKQVYKTTVFLINQVEIKFMITTEKEICFFFFNY